VKKPPAGWPQISSALFYRKPLAAIDWLVEAFGFEVHIKIAEGEVLHHSELRLGEGLIMVGGDGARPGDETPAFRRSPLSAGGNTQSLMVYVDDVDALFARARAAGAKVIREPKDTDYGAEYWADRGCELEDPEGHRWWFVQRLRSAKT